MYSSYLIALAVAVAAPGLRVPSLLISSAHNDVLAVAFVLLASLVSRRWLPGSIVLIVAAAAIKLPLGARCYCGRGIHATYVLGSALVLRLACGVRMFMVSRVGVPVRRHAPQAVRHLPAQLAAGGL